MNDWIQNTWYFFFDNLTHTSVSFNTTHDSASSIRKNCTNATPRLCRLSFFNIVTLKVYPKSHSYQLYGIYEYQNVECCILTWQFFHIYQKSDECHCWLMWMADSKHRRCSCSVQFHHSFPLFVWQTIIQLIGNLFVLILITQNRLACCSLAICFGWTEWTRSDSWSNAPKRRHCTRTNTNANTCEI